MEGDGIGRFAGVVYARCLAAVLVLALVPSGAAAVGSVSTVAPRPLGMGGAFVAVEDELAGITWNPATLHIPECRRVAGFRTHVNVLGGPAIIRETGLLTGVVTEPYSRLSGFEQFSVVVGSIIKGASARRGGLTAGVVLLEEHLDPGGLAESKGLADAGSLLDAYYTVFAVAFRLDPSVSIGVSETIYAGLVEGGDRVTGSGRSYGVLLKPNDRVSVGFTYFSAPGSFVSFRRDLEGFAPRTMNVGLAYRHTPSMLLTFDLRDMAERSSYTGLEPRFGIEKNLLGRIALRTGWFREPGTDSSVLTLGLGAIPMPPCSSGSSAVRPDSFVLNYALLLAGGHPRHLLSALLHF